MESQNNFFHLYHLGRWGWYHVTSFKFPDLKTAINYYKKEFGARNFKGKKVGSYRVTGLLKGQKFNKRTRNV